MFSGGRGGQVVVFKQICLTYTIILLNVLIYEGKFSQPDPHCNLVQFWYNAWYTQFPDSKSYKFSDFYSNILFVWYLVINL